MKYENNTGYPSVSDIIGIYEDKRWYEKYKDHRDRGNTVHDYAMAYFKGLIPPHIPEHVEPYIESFKEVIPHIKRVVLIEKRLIDHHNQCCGAIDILAVMNKCRWFDQDSRWILDWKTSKSKNRLWKAKAGGYSHLAEYQDHEHDGFATIRLRGELGKKPLIDKFDGMTLYEARKDFLAAARVYHNITDKGKIFADTQEVEHDY
jgi:hypothetical protein